MRTTTAIYEDERLKATYKFKTLKSVLGDLGRVSELKSSLDKAKTFTSFKYADPIRRETINWFKGKTTLTNLSKLTAHAEKVESLLQDSPENEDVLVSVKQELAAYIWGLSQILRVDDEPTDLSFTYEGFRIENPDLLPMADVKRILASVDYLVYVFKRRGAKRSLLDQSVQKIVLKERRSEDGFRATAFYSPSIRTITIYSDIKNHSGKMLKDWIDETLLHEIGHHIHLFLLHPVAEADWNSAWSGINEVKKQGVVTLADRKRYWKTIESSGYDYGVAGRKFKGVDRTKYLLWLYAAGPQNRKTPYISSVKVVKPTMVGLKAMEFFKDTKGYLAKYRLTEADIPKITEKIRADLRLDDTWDGPVYDPTVQSEFFKQDPDAAQAIENLGVPTNYGKTDHREDFAETFVLFMTEPHRLSETARYRMSRALSLSGLYGKEIVKLSRIVNRYLVRHTRTSRQ